MTFCFWRTKRACRAGVAASVGGQRCPGEGSGPGRRCKWSMGERERKKMVRDGERQVAREVDSDVDRDDDEQGVGPFEPGWGITQEATSAILSSRTGRSGQQNRRQALIDVRKAVMRWEKERDGRLLDVRRGPLQAGRTQGRRLPASVFGGLLDALAVRLTYTHPAW